MSRAGKAIAAGALAALLSGCSRPQAPPPPELGAGSVLTEPLQDGARGFRLRLAAGDYLEITAEQRGVDLVVALLDPAGDVLAEVDSPIGELGEETLVALASVAGEHRVELRALGASQGASFALEVRALHRATAEDRLRAEGFEIFLRGEEQRRGREPQAAIVRYQQALALFDRVGSGELTADVLLRLGKVWSDLGEQRRAARAYRRAVPLLETAGTPHREAIARDRLGAALLALGKIPAAKRSLEKALELRLQVGSRYGEAVTSSNLALAHQLLGNAQRSFDHHERALALARELGDRRLEAEVLHNLGDFYRAFGNTTRARDVLEQAVVIFEGLGDVTSRAATLDQLAQLEAAGGARQRLELALELRILAGDERGRAVTIANLGQVHRRLGDLEAAASAYREALAILERLGEPRLAAQTHGNLGAISAERGDLETALAHHHRARELFQRLEDPAGEAAALTQLAAVERRLGRLEAARQDLGTALTLSESLRRSALSHALRSSYLAVLEERFDAWVDLLMLSHRAQPRAGFDRLAFEASERGRARSLLEQLDDVRLGLSPDADPRLLEQERRLSRQLNAIGDRQRFLGGDEAHEIALRLGERRLRRLGEELESVRSRLRATGRGRGWADPEPLDLEQIRREVLDEGSQLLVFDLGRERSYLFRVTARSFESFELSGEEALETAARRTRQLLARSHRRESESAARAAVCALGRALLTPLAGRLDDRRLLVVAEGALESFPFAVLPEPGAAAGCDAPPLLARREVVSLPSASAIGLLRRQRADREDPPRGVAVIGDPVYAPGEQRFSPLRFARAEAEAILAAGPRPRLAALGPEATKALVLGGALDGHRFVHFATHGLLDVEHPELSALVLSDGLLYAHEIASLELHADAVVLSACRTALGREIRGEGLIGLARAFLYAGAARVVVSSWDVDDRATTELMQRFYRHVFAGAPPAAALRQAQIEISTLPPWQAPSFWAGFVLQGDWR